MSIEIWKEKYVSSDFAYLDGSHVKVERSLIANVAVSNGVYDSTVGRIDAVIKRASNDRINQVLVDFMDEKKLKSKSSGSSKRCFQLNYSGLGFQELGKGEILFVHADEEDRLDFIDFMK